MLILLWMRLSVNCELDLSNRPFLHYDVPLEGKIGEFDAELVEEFFRALVINAGLTCHIVINRGKNKHHIAEAVFKSFGCCIKTSFSKNKFRYS